MQWLVATILLTVAVVLIVRVSGSEGWLKVLPGLLIASFAGAAAGAARNRRLRPSGGTGDWRTNPESARRKYEVLRQNRWAVAVLLIVVLVIVGLGVLAESLTDPMLVCLVLILGSMVVGRVIYAARVKRAADGTDSR